jgi:ABC-type molybdate transport system substrate-binding protein
MRISAQLARLIPALMCLAVTGSARAWDSPAPDVVLYCTPALRAPLRIAAAQYRRATHVEVHILVGSPDGQAGLIRHRARADVIVAEAAVIETLRAEHLIRAESIVALGDDAFVLIASKHAALPTGATAAQLLATHVTILPAATPAASFDGAAILLTVFPAASFKIMSVADTQTVVVLTGSDPSTLGLVNRTESDSYGVKQAAPIPAAPVALAGALVSNGQSRNAAALLAFIAGPQGRAILQSAGVEVKS